MKRKNIYKVVFANQEKIYEIYANNVDQRDFFGFVMLEELVFGETSSVVVDPGQERLKSEFTGVKRTFIPMHSILRIDEVEKEGISKITSLGKDGNVSQFPMPTFSKMDPVSS